MCSMTSNSIGERDALVGGKSTAASGGNAVEDYVQGLWFY